MVRVLRIIYRKRAGAIQHLNIPQGNGSDQRRETLEVARSNHRGKSFICSRHLFGTRAFLGPAAHDLGLARYASVLSRTYFARRASREYVNPAALRIRLVISSGVDCLCRRVDGWMSFFGVQRGLLLQRDCRVQKERCKFLPMGTGT